jgi:hypothetical protein
MLHVALATLHPSEDEQENTWSDPLCVSPRFQSSGMISEAESWGERQFQVFIRNSTWRLQKVFYPTFLGTADPITKNLSDILHTKHKKSETLETCVSSPSLLSIHRDRWMATKRQHSRRSRSRSLPPPPKCSWSKLPSCKLSLQTHKELDVQRRQLRPGIRFATFGRASGTNLLPQIDLLQGALQSQKSGANENIQLNNKDATILMNSDKALNEKNTLPISARRIAGGLDTSATFCERVTLVQNEQRKERTQTKIGSMRLSLPPSAFSSLAKDLEGMRKNMTTHDPKGVMVTDKGQKMKQTSKSAVINAEECLSTSEVRPRRCSEAVTSKTHEGIIRKGVRAKQLPKKITSTLNFSDPLLCQRTLSVATQDKEETPKTSLKEPPKRNILKEKHKRKRRSMFLGLFASRSTGTVTGTFFDLLGVSISNVLVQKK